MSFTGRKITTRWRAISIEQSNNGLITFAGGLPINNANGEVIAAVGVSGSTIENDLAVAQAAIAQTE
ncbi:MAG: heme-binding protein [Colwellia sp.]|nr:heme-binding protein [Colwellia sp.]